MRVAVEKALLETAPPQAEGFQPGFDAFDLAVAEGGCAARHSRKNAVFQVDRGNRADQVRNAQFTGNRPGDESVGGGDDGAQVAVVQMPAHPLASLVADDGQDVAGHVFGVPGVKFFAAVTGEWRKLKIQESMDVERASLVLIIKLVVLCFLQFTVDDALADQELRPLEIRVAGKQCVVEVEKGEFHAVTSLLSRSRSSGRVTARLCSSV